MSHKPSLNRSSTAIPLEHEVSMSTPSHTRRIAKLNRSRSVSQTDTMKEQDVHFTVNNIHTDLYNQQKQFIFVYISIQINEQMS
jgi:hypothetical protein